jgi:anhydro-N-acetylmuramic acid kinase
MKAPSALYIGLMSGTSMDGVDAVLVDIQDGAPLAVAGHTSLPLPDDLRHELMALNAPGGGNELERAALAANALARVYAQATRTLLRESGQPAQNIRAIGAHGQTVRHRPELGYTLQLNAPALLAELTGIDVIADFRSRDVAAGGQGAPLVPPFHAGAFGSETPRAILNLGGIANVTLLAPNAPVRGFDTGPANALLDLWCLRHTGRPYDDEGAWAAGGSVIPHLLQGLIASEPWFAMAPPKSTGRDLFNASWLEERLAQLNDGPHAPADVQATLVHLTARTVADAIEAAAPHTHDVLVCGGGASNAYLMQTLAHYLQRPVRSTATEGVDPQLVEALAFAWLAWAHVNGVAAGLPSVTGARSARVLGCCYRR